MKTNSCLAILIILFLIPLSCQKAPSAEKSDKTKLIEILRLQTANNESLRYDVYNTLSLNQHAPNYIPEFTRVYQKGGFKRFDVNHFDATGKLHWYTRTVVRSAKRYLVTDSGYLILKSPGETPPDPAEETPDSGPILLVEFSKDIKAAGFDEIDGKSCVVFLINHPDVTCRVWVWKDTSLVVREEYINIAKNGDISIRRIERRNISYAEIPDETFDVPEKQVKIVDDLPRQISFTSHQTSKTAP